MMHINKIIIKLVAIACIAFWIFSFVTTFRPATNNPRAFLKRGRHNTTKKVVVCLGDSITHATISGDYVAILQKQFATQGYEFVNAGINGNTSYHLLQRLDEVIACQPDIVTILIGTNDINATRGALERIQYFLPYVPSLDVYLQNISAIVTRLQTETSARIILLSPPPLGEDLDSELNQRVKQYSDGLKNIAAKNAALYIPLFEELCARLKGHSTSSPFRGDVDMIFGTAFRHYVGRKNWDELAAENGFYLLTDSIHLNNRAAALVAKLITVALDDNPQTALEQKFSATWDDIENFFTTGFTTPDWAYLKSIFNLIAKLRERGYDKKLRAGQSIEYLVLSRSKEHGLKRGQSMIRFELKPQGGMSVFYFEAPDVKIHLEVDHVALTPEIEALLARLLSHPID